MAPITSATRKLTRGSSMTYGEFSELLRTARKLITSVREIDAEDLNLPERSTNFSVNVGELGERAAGAEKSLQQTSDDFKVQLAAPDTATWRCYGN